MSKSNPEIEHDGRLVAVIKREGGGRSGAPVQWLVYWGLAYQQHQHRRFTCSHEARAWVHQMLVQQAGQTPVAAHAAPAP